MLCQADASLVRRDPLIPGLGTLLDPEAFAESLRRAYPGAGVTTAEPRYVRYKPGTSCLVGYWVAGRAGSMDVYARAHSTNVSQKMEKAAQRESVPSPLGDGIKVLADNAVVIYPYPNDHELPALQHLDRPQARREMLQQVLPDRADLWDGPLEPLRYKPERRYVAHLRTTPGGGAVLKFYTKEDYEVRKENVDTFASLPPLRVPQRLGRSRRYHLAAIEWLDGIPLGDALARSEAPGASGRAVGAAMARLHAQKPKKLQTRWTSERYTRLLGDAAGAVAEIAPELGDRAQRLARRLGDKLATRHWRGRRAIHGDCSADQVLLQGESVAIVDFDRAGYGDPRIDLGTFQARLLYDVILGVLTRDRAEACFNALLEEYRNESEKDVTRKLQRYSGASLLQCAVEPFRLRHRDWPEKLEAIIAEAELLAGGAEASL
ncbi:MAG: aminoglycoside phosphotransferase family protein [Planctomycetota bacterium]|jgi:aminoglycoside phosphotransferase (APT) family kinase protein